MTRKQEAQIPTCNAGLGYTGLAREGRAAMLAGKILSDARIPRAGAPRGRRPLRGLLLCLGWAHIARLRAAHAYLGLLNWLPADRARPRVTAEVGTGSGNGMERAVSGGQRLFRVRAAAHETAMRVSPTRLQGGNLD